MVCVPLTSSVCKVAKGNNGNRSPTAPTVQLLISCPAQKAKSWKVRYCSFLFPVSKRLLAKKTMAA